jgi:subtilase family serine protease
VLNATNDEGGSGFLPSGACCYAQRVVQWPATDPLVTAVGGTELRLDATGTRTGPDVAWNDTWDPFLQPQTNKPPPVPWSGSGGLSTIFSRPGYQNSVARLGPGRRHQRATPEFAGIVAIADQYARKRFRKKRLGLIDPALYELARRHALGIVDVTGGNNTVAFRAQPGGPITTVTGYSARVGYTW